MPARIIFPQRGEVALESFEPPPLEATDLRVRTLYSLMSIGTETTILDQRYAPDSHFAQWFSFPQLKTGVQALGEIEQVGDAVSEFAPGERVYMRMAHGSHQVLLAEHCSPVPEGIGSKNGCWCGLAKTAFRAAWAGRFEEVENVLIVGAGPVGQMLTRWGAYHNVRDIVVADLSEQRLTHARRGGATLTLAGELTDHAQTLARAADGQPPLLIVDTTGNPAVFQQALGALRKFGRLILLGDTGFPGRQCLSSDVMTKGLTIQATHDSHDRDGWTQRRIDALFFEAALEGRFDLEGLITHEFSPRDCAKAYRLANEERESAMGILFDWQSESW